METVFHFPVKDLWRFISGGYAPPYGDERRRRRRYREAIARNPHFFAGFGQSPKKKSLLDFNIFSASQCQLR
jgi:hypothetical protein